MHSKEEKEYIKLVEKAKEYHGANTRLGAFIRGLLAIDDRTVEIMKEAGFDPKLIQNIEELLTILEDPERLAPAADYIEDKAEYYSEKHVAMSDKNPDLLGI